MRKHAGLYVTASALALISNSAHAQDGAGAAEADDNEIVVIGTNIRGAEAIGSPVQNISAEALADSGRATVADMVRELPVNFAGGVATADNNQGGQDTTSRGANLTGGSGVNLRGLGALSTLVLVDGRRVAVSGQFGDFVDISNISAASISRIEILQDGASAVYGADAVGGVVNIVTRKRGDGLNLLGRVGTTTEGGGLELQASATFGKNWGGGGFIVGYEYNKRDNVLGSQRSLNGDLSQRGGVNWPLYTGRAGSAANIFAASPSFNGAVAYTVPNDPGTGLTIAQLTPVTNGIGNTFDPWDAVDILPKMERHSVFASVDHDLSDSLNLRASARYTRRDGRYNLGYANYFGAVPTTNPAYIAGVTNNFGVVIDEVPLVRNVSVDSYAGEVGARFDLSDAWALDASFSYSREKQNRYSTILRDGSNVFERNSAGAFGSSSIICALQGTVSVAPSAAQAFCNAQNYQTWNPYSTQPLSAQVLSQLIGYEDLSFDSRMWQATLKADGSLFALGGGDAKLAVGVDLRKEVIDGDLDFNYRSIASQHVPYGRTSQKVFSAFGELALPFVSDDNAVDGIAALDISAAVRYERSEDLRGFETTNPKVGFRYAPVKGFNLRGSWGTSFHAPPMRFQYNGPQPVPGGNAIFYANAFYTAPCNTTLVPLNGFSGTPGSPTGSCTFTGMVVSGGAGPTLKPEKATTFSLGIDIAPEPLPEFRASISYFNLKIKDRLVRITSGTLGGILSNYFATGSSPFIGNLVFNPDDALVQSLFDDPRFIGKAGPGPNRTADQIGAIIFATQTNLATLKMDGIDMAVSYDLSLGDSQSLRFFGNGTLVTSYNIRGAPGSPFQKKLGLYETTGNPVSLKGKVGLDLNLGGFNGILTLNHTAGYECRTGCFVPDATGAPVGNTAPVKIKSWNTFDLHLGYEFGGDRILAGTNLALDVNNLFNTAPPFIDTGRVTAGNTPESYDGANATIIGRTIALTLSRKF